MNIELEDAISVIRESYTEASLGDFDVVGNGFGCFVLLSDDGMIFRIAKNIETAKQYVMECKVLPRLMKYIPLNIPNPIWYRFNATSAPYGIMAYKRLKGNPIELDKMNQSNRKSIANEVANYINSIHQVPYEKLEVAYIPNIRNDKKTLEALRESTFEFLKKELTVEENRKVEDWWEEILADDKFFQYKPSLCHGDLWYENILVDDTYTHVIGVVDFSNMRIGDPAVDLAPQYYLGKEFYDEVLLEYTHIHKDDMWIAHRIRRHQELREISGLQYVIKNNLFDEYKDSIAKIRERVIL